MDSKPSKLPKLKSNAVSKPPSPKIKLSELQDKPEADVVEAPVTPVKKSKDDYAICD
jgi:hypothetical protein